MPGMDDEPQSAPSAVARAEGGRKARRAQAPVEAEALRRRPRRPPSLLKSRSPEGNAQPAPKEAPKPAPSEAPKAKEAKKEPAPAAREAGGRNSPCKGRRQPKQEASRQKRSPLPPQAPRRPKANAAKLERLAQGRGCPGTARRASETAPRSRYIGPADAPAGDARR